MQMPRTLTNILLSALFLVGCASSGFSETPADPTASADKSHDPSASSARVEKNRQARDEAAGGRRATADSTAEEIALLKEQLAFQQKQIEQLRVALEDQKRLLEKALEGIPRNAPGAAKLGEVASIQPVIPSGSTPAAGGPPAHPAGFASAPATQAEIARYTAKVDDVDKKLDGALKNLGGFKLSGDFRFRGDAQLRSGNNIAGPLQNVRARYRLRLNLDKEIDPRFNFRLQLSTGPLNNGLTNDQDFAGTVAKNPFSIAEAYVDFHPNSNFSMRGGRMEEVFADNMRFLWDDDVRFNGFHEIIKLALDSAPLGIKSVEFRSGEYFLTNPNVVILSPTSPFASAGFQPGKKVGDANLFHPGFVIKGDLGSTWNHQFTGDVQVYRNPDQIQLASLANGFPVLVSNALGIALSGPMSGTGNATTTPGGGVFSAPNFQIVRAAYRVERTGWRFHGREMPVWLDFQASRNTGTGKLRDAVMASANVGSVKKAGDVRFLYQFAIKDANALISQFTDDDLGTGSGVNIRVHALRFDLGLTRYLQWQNLFFIQNQQRSSNPAEQFFVPLQKGANTTFRYLGQLAFSF